MDPLPLTYRNYHLPIYTHTLKGPPVPHPLLPTQREYRLPTYNTHTLKGAPTPTPTPDPQGVPPTNLQYSYTKGTPHPHPLPPTHREYHPPTYNTHTLKGPPAPLSPTPKPQEVPPTNLQHS